MTKNEMLKMIVEGATVTAEMEAKAAEMLAADAKAKEARKGKVSEKDQVKRNANEALARHIAADILTAEAKTATDVAAVLTEETGEEVKVQKASYLCRLAVTLQLANETDVKIPKKGSQKAYTAVEA
jgi:lipopolysaccharide biosynthesis regulator YciM